MSLRAGLAKQSLPLSWISRGYSGQTYFEFMEEIGSLYKVWRNPKEKTYQIGTEKAEQQGTAQLFHEIRILL